MSIKINNHKDYNYLNFGVKNIFSSKSYLLIYAFFISKIIFFELKFKVGKINIHNNFNYLNLREKNVSLL